MVRSFVAAMLRLLRAVARGIGALLLRWGDASRSDRSGPQTEHGEAHDANDAVGVDDADGVAASTSYTAEEASRSPAELVTTLISLLLIGALAGAILYDSYARGESVPANVEVTVDVTATSRVGDAFHVPFEARNTGDRTIEEVLLAFTVYDGEEIVEETDTVIALLGEHGSVSGMLVLDQDPAGLDIEAAVSTFHVAEE